MEKKPRLDETGYIPVRIKGDLREVIYTSDPARFITEATHLCMDKRTFLSYTNNSARPVFEAAFVSRDCDVAFKYVIVNPSTKAEEDMARLRLELGGTDSVAGRLRISKQGDIFTAYWMTGNEGSKKKNHSLWLEDVKNQDQGTIEYSRIHNTLCAKQGRCNRFITLDGKNGRALDETLAKLKEQFPIEIEGQSLQGVEFYDEMSHIDAVRRL